MLTVPSTAPPNPRSLTTAAPWVIHTVGRVWRGGTNGEAEPLVSCYRQSLARADETGIFGYPTGRRRPHRRHPRHDAILYCHFVMS